MIAYNLSFKELKKHKNKLAIIATGSTEQHGPYLPLGTDAIAAESTTLALEQKMSQEVVVFPTLYFGCAKEHKKFPGTIYLEYSTYLSLMKDIIRSIFSAGFSNLLIIGGHGGNDQILRIIQSDWNYDHEDQKVLYLFAFTENVKQKGIELFESMESHAGSVETSLIYAINSKYIKTNRSKITNKQFLRRPGSSLSLQRTDEISKIGVVSSTDVLTIDPKKGGIVFDVMVEDAINYAKQIINNSKNKGK